MKAAVVGINFENGKTVNPYKNIVYEPTAPFFSNVDAEERAFYFESLFPGYKFFVLNDEEDNGDND